MAAAIALLYFGRAFCITLVVSVILAFMLEPFVGLFLRLRMPRSVASFLVCTIAIFALYMLGAAFVTQLLNFAEDLPQYSQRINAMVDNVAARLERAEREAYALLVPRRFQTQPAPQQQPDQPRIRRSRRDPVSPPEIPEVRIRDDRGGAIGWVAGYITSLYNALLMASFVPFLVYFMLSWRNHVHGSLLAIYGARDRTVAGRSLQTIANMARAYVVGNVILGIAISLVSCALFWSWHLPYWILLGFVSGFLSLVPYVGLPLAILPPLGAALVAYTTVTPYLVIAAEVAALHLLGLNLLYPAFVGARVHLNPLAVTVALMFWGTLWGGIGLILAIPMTAALKAVLDNNEDLQAYGQLLGDQDEGESSHSAA
ncbi:MAG TPA: AI-2E family transporter [Bryobacteraceae bacterium]|nr:AI-2E family transporter [Bryobacteraceae bacterium]